MPRFRVRASLANDEETEAEVIVNAPSANQAAAKCFVWQQWPYLTLILVEDLDQPPVERERDYDTLKLTDLIQ